MPRYKLRFRRDPVLYATVLIELLVLHFVLCYPAAIARGWPPLEPFWMVSIFLSFLGIGFLPAFDDFSYAPRTRWIALTEFVVASSLMLSVVFANASSGRPSTGHLTGYLGVIYHHWIGILFRSCFTLSAVLPFLFCWESVAQGLWNLVREFSTPRPTPMRLGGLLRIVVTVGILCGAVRFVVSLDPWYFGRPFLMQ